MCQGTTTAGIHYDPSPCVAAAVVVRCVPASYLSTSSRGSVEEKKQRRSCAWEKVRTPYSRWGVGKDEKMSCRVYQPLQIIPSCSASPFGLSNSDQRLSLDNLPFLPAIRYYRQPRSFIILHILFHHTTVVIFCKGPLEDWLSGSHCHNITTTYRNVASHRFLFLLFHHRSPSDYRVDISSVASLFLSSRAIRSGPLTPCFVVIPRIEEPI